MEFYTDKNAWTFPPNQYPTWDDCMRFYMSRIQENMSQKAIIQSLAEEVEKIWKSGDGCPKSVSSIVTQFERYVLPQYKKNRKGDMNKKGKKKKKLEKPAQSPARRSLRAQPDPHTDPDPPHPADDQGGAQAGQSSPSVHVSNRREASERKAAWLQDFGNSLFDVFSEVAMVKTLEEGLCFDSDFYEDQLDNYQRKLVIETVRVRKEFVEAEKKLNATKARKFARNLSAFGKSQVVQNFVDTLHDDLDEDIERSPFKAPARPVSDTSRSNIVTRNARRSLADVMETNQNIISLPSLPASLGLLCNRSTQTEVHSLDDIDIPAVSTRKKTTKTGASQSRLCHESYLQAGLLMCSVANQSPSQAVMNMMIMDTQVYKQRRRLPLILQKKYQLQLKKMKKIKASLNRHQGSEAPVLSEEAAGANENADTSDNESGEDIVLLETEAELSEPAYSDTGYNSPPSKKSKLDEITDFVNQAKTSQKVNLGEVLPDPRSIRRAQHQAASFLEGEIGNLMVRDGKTFLMPDGTSRAKVGKMGATLVKIEGKMRALKLQCMGNEQRDNWADTIIHQLERLSSASDISIKDIYRSICSLVSDSCKVNKGLAALISSKLGLEWVPGQLYCLIHSVLGFQDGISSTWLKYQAEIGHDKLYPSVTGFELDVEDKGLIKQIMEMYLRLTADRWQARSWNRYEEYTIFCSERSVQNMGQELHGNRFGELEK